MTTTSILNDPDEFLNRLASSPPVTWQVPPNAVIRLDHTRGLDRPLLEGAVIVGWTDTDVRQGRSE